ncbi:metal dependent phosphohydrolase [Magnetococcus marinus MC-1]|uniref:Metal dependent phosphohydrolase n=1 Tax=Magnetococcus marinus (strain ATCC BAA-1437 / JCM 17883 / MC-1) TaxID=156889 RepID=A0L7K5_MAGMM|nr:HDIG domain-containing metalloprotein [Magnetococcus marinus]ABK43948.1 metal dependent phosphohydrolase [Magnetococcus marinus MC-1]
MAEETHKPHATDLAPDDRLNISLSLRTEPLDQKPLYKRLVIQIRESHGWSWGGFALLVGLLTLIYSPLALRMPHVLEVGEVATRNIKAERDVLVEDRAATELRREKAVAAVPPVFDWDPHMVASLSSGISDRLVELHEAMHTLAKSGQWPEQKTLEQAWGERYTLPSSILKALFEVSGLMQALDAARKQAQETPLQAVPLPEGAKLDGAQEAAAHALVQATKPSPMALFLEPKGLNPGFEHLLARIQNWLKTHAHHWVVADSATQTRIQRRPINLNPLDNPKEFRLTIPDRVVTLEQLTVLLRDSARRQMGDLNPDLRLWVVDQVLEYLHPNLTYNSAETRLRQIQAEEDVDQVYLRVRRGQMVVLEGEVVSENTQLKLSALNKGDMSDAKWLRVLGLSITVALFLYIGRLFLLRTAAAFPRDRLTVEILGTLLVISASLSAVTLALGQGMAGVFQWPAQSVIYLPPVAMGSAMASLIIGARVSLPGGTMVVGTALSFLTSQLAGGGLPLFIFYMIGSLMGGLSLRTCRRRFDVLRSGLAIGLVQIAVIPAVELLNGNTPGIDWVYSMSMGLMSGLLAGLFALALIPLMESLFNITTDSRLMELAAGDHPLLRELSMRSPGTYHHSVMMGNLAEEAAEKIGANPLLARVMALYHDIGKMAKPAYFVENQSGANRHDQLSPSMSAKIIMSHVKAGIAMARQYKLGEPIEEAILTHQGTSLLQFFYNKALNESARRGEVVDAADYRYPGPIPQTREAGILMLADSVEAATRSLKDPAPAQIQAMVRRIINNKIRDGQLDDCKLTMRELSLIEEAFLRVLTLGFYHRRIAYPEIRKPSREGASNVPSLGAIVVSSMAKNG